ncbi:MAG: hypothetical protein U0694_28645 [Anaerolineae bacterium]
MDFLKISRSIYKPVWLVALLLITFSSAAAQETLLFATPVNGTVSAGSPQSWNFNARDGEVLSFLVQGAAESLDPVLTITTAEGTVLIANDDYDYPASRDSLLEAITIPRTATYTATVSAFGSTSGDYTLTMLPGYAQVADSQNFNGESTWQTGDDSALETAAADGLLDLSLVGIGVQGVARDASGSDFLDSYAQVSVSGVSGAAGWRVGMTMRQQDRDNYYAVFVNSDGLWRLSLHSAQGESVLRDWTAHPAIVAGQTAFTLGVLANGSNLEFFYNGQYVGQLMDTAINRAGQTGFIVGTGESLNADVRARFDDLLITTPFETSAGGVFPQQLVGGSAQATVQELQRRRLIPTQGDMALVVDESFGQAVRPGVSRYPLGRGLSFTSFAYGANVTIQPQAAGTTGCGLVFRNISDTDYTVAFIDQSGGYGLSQRVNDQFQPGIFGQNPASNDLTHDLLVIANGDILYYYIDGLHVGTLTLSASEGSIGNAVVNFDPIDTTCQFNDTWLWRWGE